MTNTTPVPNPTTTPVLSQDELKTLVGQAALQYVVPGDIVGVGTGSTVNKFIDALASMKDQIKGRGVQFGGQYRAFEGAGNPGF
jgi:ribose 5-phosphate isomerase A